MIFDTKAGTFYCYVYAISPVASPSLLAAVQENLNQNSAFPITGTALNPDLAGISMAATVTLLSSATQTDQQTVIANASQAVEDYINNLRVGQQLIIHDISDKILNSSPLIVDVGQPNQMLGEVYLWRSRADGSRYSRRLIANYTPATGERITVEDRTPLHNLQDSRESIRYCDARCNSIPHPRAPPCAAPPPPSCCSTRTFRRAPQRGRPLR
jgi:hypothetical protein